MATRRRPRTTPDNVVALHPAAIPGQTGRPGSPDTTRQLRQRLSSVTGPAGTCGHPKATVTVTSPAGGSRLVCHQCVLAAAGLAAGISLIQPTGGDCA